MGSIASVLQWHCSGCSLINPTESARCTRCGLARVRSDQEANEKFFLTNKLADDLSRKELSNKDEQVEQEEQEEGENEEASSEESTPPTPPPRLRIPKPFQPNDSLPQTQLNRKHHLALHSRGRVVSKSPAKKLQHGSWSGYSCNREPLKRSTSLPSLVTQWTCIRCLLENSCSSTLTCTACDASSLIGQIDGRQIGVRKSKKLDRSKQEKTTELSTRILNTGSGTVCISTSKRTASNKGNSWCKIIGRVRSAMKYLKNFM